jgi:VWFA-related protein
MQGLLRWSLLIVGLIALLFMQSARAEVALRVQALPAEDPIQAFVTVTDSSGNPVSGLTAADFTVLVDGVAVSAPALSQPPTQDPNQHVSVVFAMDYSPSVVENHVAVMRQAVIDFINAMDVGDYAAIVKFNVTNPNGASVVLPFTRIDGAAGTQALIDAVNADYEGRESNIFDGVTVSVGHLAAPPAPLPAGPKAIILVTDGDENNSTADINTAIAAAVDAGTAIFTVGIGDFSSATSQQILNALPNGTGGTFYPAPTDADVGAAYAEISQLLNNEYVITYTSSIADCATHTLEVRVNGQARQTAFTRCATTLVPNVRGMTIAEATAALTNAGLVVGTVTEQNSTSRIVSVVAQSPTVGAERNPGTAVGLTISSGVPVPNVVGMTEAAARTAITGAGLRVGTVTQQSSSTVALGNVISQSPASGQVEGSSAVTMVVSSGPAKSSSGGGGGATGPLELLAGLLLLAGLMRRRRDA